MTTQAYKRGFRKGLQGTKLQPHNTAIKHLLPVISFIYSLYIGLFQKKTNKGVGGGGWGVGGGVAVGHSISRGIE